MPSVSAPAPEVLQYPLGAGSVITRVLECGGGEDHIMFVHGLGARADRWRITLPAFAAAGYHSYAVDLPGHGLATKGADIPLNVPGFADFLTATLDGLGIRSAFIVGRRLVRMSRRRLHVRRQLECAG